MTSRIVGEIGCGALLVMLTVGAWTVPSQRASLAGRYHLRQRTTQFFERAKTPTIPTAKPALSPEPIRISTAKQPQTA